MHKLVNAMAAYFLGSVAAQVVPIPPPQYAVEIVSDMVSVLAANYEFGNMNYILDVNSAKNSLFDNTCTQSLGGAQASCHNSPTYVSNAA